MTSGDGAMTLPGTEPADAREAVARELRRVGDRLRSMPLQRLEGDLAAAARRASQRLADLSADAEGERRRPMPVLAAHALGDQVTVTGNDLLAAADDQHPSHPRGQVSDAALTEALEVLVGLRQRL